jgi:hypothetical protein
MRIMRRWATAAIVVVVTLAGGVFVARPFVHGLSFVIRAAEMDGTTKNPCTNRFLRDLREASCPRGDLQVFVINRYVWSGCRRSCRRPASHRAAPASS